MTDEKSAHMPQNPHDFQKIRTTSGKSAQPPGNPHNLWKIHTAWDPSRIQVFSSDTNGAPNRKNPTEREINHTVTEA